MDILQLFLGAVVLVLVRGGALLVCSAVSQLLMIRRDARSRSRTTPAAELVDSIHRELLSQGFSESEARDAVRDSKADPHAL